MWLDSGKENDQKPSADELIPHIQGQGHNKKISIFLLRKHAIQIRNISYIVNSFNKIYYRITTKILSVDTLYPKW